MDWYKADILIPEWIIAWAASERYPLHVPIPRPRSRSLLIYSTTPRQEVCVVFVENAR
jgi:hypothetical protein